MDDSDTVRVWISPKDVCVLASLSNGELPTKCNAMGAEGPTDHILVSLTRGQMRALWMRGGCQDSSSGMPLVGPDGRLMCVFDQIEVPRPEHVKSHNDQDKYASPEERRDLEKNIKEHLRNRTYSYYNKDFTQYKDLTKKAHVNAHKLISKKGFVDEVIKNAKEYQNCIKNQLNRISDAVQKADSAALEIQKKVNIQLRAGVDMEEFENLRQKMEAIGNELEKEIEEDMVKKISECEFTSRTPQHDSSPESKGLIGRARQLIGH